jgi:molybdate transport system substrate-binding protein
MKRPEHKAVWMTVMAVVAFASMCFVFGAAFRSRPDSAPSENRHKTELLLYCGAGIQPVAEALTEAFWQEYNITINATYAGSGRLLGQLATSQVGDLFMPGSAFYVDRAIEKKLVHEHTKQTVAYFVPVIVVHPGNPLDVTSQADLAEKKLRLGLGDERAVAVGKQAARLFDKNHIPQAEIAKNVVYRSGTVNELGVAMQMKHIDAAIMWDANARQFANALEVIDIPPEQNLVSTIPVAVLTCSEFPDDAKRFVDFVTSPVGKTILKAYDYTVELNPSHHATRKDGT